MQSPPLKTFVPPHLQPARRINLPWSKPERWRSAATITGYITWAALAVFLIVDIYRIGTDPGGLKPPFTQREGMTRNALLVNEEASSGINGDGATMQVWRLSGSPSELRNAVTNKITNNLFWFHRPFDERDRKAFEFVSSAPEYQKAAPFVKEIETGDFYFAYQQLRTVEDGRVTDAGIWLFSPDKMLLVFLNENT